MINEFAASVLVLLFSSYVMAWAFVKDVKVSLPFKFLIAWVVGGIFFSLILSAYALARFLGAQS